MEDRVVVARAEGAALAAGVHAGMVVTTLDGADARARIDALAESAAGARLDTRRRAGIRAALDGSGDLRLGLSGIGDVAVPRDRADLLDDLPDRPATAVLDGKWLYLDVNQTSAEPLKKLAAGVQGVIVDGRGYPGSHDVFDIPAHFVSAPVASQDFYVHTRTGPGDADVEIPPATHWSVAPIKPRLDIPVVFLADARAVSQAELFLEMAKQAHLGVVIGEATAGVDGNVTELHLPDRVVVPFTGMRCENRDGTPFHTHGVQPDIAVNRTIAGVAAGRDEALEVAETWLKNHAPPPR